MGTRFERQIDDIDIGILFNNLKQDLEESDSDNFSPVLLGLPKLESKEQLQTFVEKRLYFKKDGKRKTIKLIPEQVRFIWDIFSGKVKLAVVWKSRGGGGSLTVAILIFLMMVYKGKSFKDLAGSGDQAKNVYRYTQDFWYCEDKVAKILDGDPLQSRTRLKTGNTLECVACSETQARGDHPPGLIIDEAAQKERSKDDIFESAIQMVFSEEDYVVIILSTFHIPVGFFQDYWDNAEKKGFTRYKWNVYDTLRKCTVEIDCRDCPLTEKVAVFEKKTGKIKEYKYDGCNGRARKTDGYLSRDNALAAKRANKKDNWAVEWECKRPKSSGLIFPLNYQEKAWKRLSIIRDVPTFVGIDWGYGVQTSIITAQRYPEFVGITNEAFYERTPLREISSYLTNLRRRVGDFKILADASHPFNNTHLEEDGFLIDGIAFNKWKKFAIDNVILYLEYLKMLIDPTLLGLIASMKIWHRDKLGNISKKGSHGSEALICAMLGFYFLNEFEVDKETGNAYTVGLKSNQVLLLGGKD